MLLSDLLPLLRERGIRLTLQGDRVQVSAPEGAVTDEVRRALAAHKSELVKLLGEQTRSGPRLTPREPGTAAPLSHHQERIWLFQELEPDETGYNLAARAELQGPLDRDALGRALRTVIARHEPLHSLLVRDGDTIRQQVAPIPADPLVLHDVSGLPDSDLEEAVREIQHQEHLRPFRLDRNLPLRVHLIRTGPESHVLVAVFHHTAADGFSLPLFFRDLVRAYGGDPLEPLAVSYSDFAAWEREWWDDERLGSEIEFWADYLKGAPLELELPTDHPRPPRQTFRGRIITRPLDPGVAAGLRSLIAEEGVTLFTALLAAFATTLHRRSGQRDLVLGTPVAGRTQPALSEMVGMFVNQLPLRVGVDRGATFRELIGATHRSVRSAMAHEELPFPLLVEELSPPRDPSRTPFFQATVNVIPPVRTELPETRGLKVRLEGAEGAAESFDGHSRFDLTLYGQEIDDQFHIALVYNPDLYSEETARGLSDDVLGLLDRGARHPDGDLSGLTSRADRTGTGNPTRLPEPSRPMGPAESITARFEEMAERYPDAPAILLAHGAELSYRDLRRRAASVAGRVAVSVPSGHPVGVLVAHDAAIAEGIFGVLRSGRPYVPLDAAWPDSRLRQMVEDAGVGGMVTTPSLGSRARTLMDGPAQVVELDGSTAEPSSLPPMPGPGDPAYLLYTSGSTGRPKAVRQSHRNVVRQAERYAHALDLGPGARVTLTASISFDACVMDLFGALLSGAALSPVDLREVDLARLPEVVEERGLTVVHMTPTVFRTLSRSAPAARFPTVRTLVLGGEPVRASDVAHFDGAFPAAAWLLNLYGSAEHSFAIGSRVDRSLYRRSAEVPIGYPVDDVEVLLLDDTDHPDPVRGVLALRSDFSSPGYHQRPELTATVFPPDSERPGQVLYRSGDVMRRRPDGALVFLHRIDDQMKIRGHRIEPAEVETFLTEHPDVFEVGVHAPEGPDGLRHLVACVVPVPNASPTVAALAEWCRERLPPYMVPGGWVFLTSLPRTGTHKIDRKALPLPEDDPGSTGDPGGVPPRNAEEEAIAEVWSDVLEMRGLGVHQDFFELGGHSLAATRVVARVRDLFDAEISLRDFFDHPTIAEIAERVRSGEGSAPAMPPLVPCAGERAPLSFSQERIWFLQVTSPENVAYNMAASVLLEGPLDVERLRAAIHAVAERQVSLRTHIRTEGGRPHQSVGPEPIHTLIVEDLGGLPASDRLNVARDRSVELLGVPYDLEADPLFRPALFRLGEDRHLFALGMHHIISDMWSMAVFGREIAAVYNEPDAPALPSLEVGYPDYAVWQRDWLRGAPLEEQLGYWLERLGGVRPLDLPTDFPRPQFFAYGGGLVRRELPPGIPEGVQALTSESRATPFMAYLAVFNVLLATHARQTDVAVGVPIANRTQVASERLIGSFVNTLVHRNDLSGNPTFRELLAQVRETALGAYAHQDMPFELLVKELNPARDTSRPPIFQVLFNVANVQVTGGEFEGVRRRVIPLPRHAAQFELGMVIELNALQSDISLTYNGALFTEKTAGRLLNHYLDILQRAVQNPDLPLSALQAIPDADRRRVIESWNRTERNPSKDPSLAGAPASVPAMLDATAARCPDRVAVDSPTGSWSYAELKGAAGRVTAALQQLGVGAGDHVGILAERSREMLAGLVGIMGAGATYIPLDPAYPEARVRYMLEHSGARALVTHRGLERPFAVDLPVLDLDGGSLPDAVDFAATPPESNAYVIYTSGSTGTPKGVAVPHRAVGNFLHSMARTPGIDEEDRLLAVTTISFDISVLELYLPLLVGARVVIASDDETKDGRRLADRISGEAVTVMQATPATWKLLMSAGWQGKADLKVLSGGEALPPSLAGELLARTGEVWNMYGPTETTVWSTVQRILPDEPILIGQPIDNTRIYILDEEHRPLPIGVPGELWIAGDGVASGYLGQPDLTEERFVASPFRDKERMYRTGDLARWRSDGRLEHLGRLDHQVKVRGFRIELGEVEATLRSHPGVRDVVVVAREDRLVAYPLLTLDAPSPGDLRRWVADRLPPYMVPGIFVALDTFPLTPNGKVDRKALPEPGAQIGESRRHEPPAGPDEVAIAEVWKELLGVPRVGRQDNFFELGGHSLLAMEAVAMVEERAGHRLDPRTFFFRSLEEIASSLPSAVGS